jgi:NarL family two-component system sensor histidine kinase LiaS
LQWKLTLAYTLSTLVTILVLGIIALAVLWYINFRSNIIPQAIADGLNKATPALRPYLEQLPPDREGLNQWLQIVTRGNNLVINIPRDQAEDRTETVPAQFGRISAVVIVDKFGKIVAAVPAEQFGVETPLQPFLPPEAVAGFRAALQGQTDPSALAIRAEGDDMMATVPILSEDQQLLGAIYVKLSFPVEAREFLQTVFQQVILPFAGMMLVVGLIVGAFFGFLVARSLTRRLLVVTGAADAWSEGNFDILVQDNSTDELGQLTRHLNHMVIQLQNLLQTRQELAGLEERNRLARDLHDSVKQQIFATAMQVGAARTLIDQHPAEAKGHLVEAEQLVRQAQQELSTLIQELRPAALEGKGLARALQDHVTIWSRQTNILAELRVSGERPLPLPSEQTLFRVAQEALANVARHSQATGVEIQLGWTPSQVRLVIADNGRGFNPARQNGKGLGLQSMSERLEMIGGHLSVDSQPGSGTRITAQIPINNLSV